VQGVWSEYIGSTNHACSCILSVAMKSDDN
jgi:hypothetical protein